MSDLDLDRRLSAILAADAVGYSSLMQVDPRAVISELNLARSLFRAHIQANGGRIVDFAGDSVLAVFDSAFGAVRAALHVQRRIARANRFQGHRLSFRIGIHAGDIVQKSDGTVYGDGVNIASRLQNLAEAGGIVVSDTIRSLVGDGNQVQFSDRGTKTLKNIRAQVRTFAVGNGGPDGDVLDAGPYRLNRLLGTITRTGTSIELAPYAFELFLMLAENSPESVPKNQLLERVWPEPANEKALQAEIALLRKTLGRDAILTIPGKGYGLPSYSMPIVAPAESAARSYPSIGVPVVAETASGRLYGRSTDIVDITELVHHHRLVSIVGPAGIGKTSVAAAVTKGLPSESVWVELAPVSEAALLPIWIAEKLGITVPGNDPAGALVNALRERGLLLVLDNCEHMVLAIAPLLRSLLNQCAAIRILATSQSSLKLEGERVFRIGPLQLPPLHASAAVAQTYGAVGLFVEQAQAADRTFVLEAENVMAVVHLCAHLDGLALAIKLAAARLPLFGLAGLQTKLTERFRLLRNGPRDAPLRQQTLAAALDWSYSLLTTSEQAVFQRLSAFPSSFSLDLASKTVGGQGQDAWAVVEAIESLVEKSLVAIDSRQALRYRLLESARAYANMKLAESGDASAVHETIAGVLRDQFSGLAEGEPQVLAFHLAEAGKAEEAIVEWEKAAARSSARMANVEAVVFLTCATELLCASRPYAGGGSARQQKELDIRLHLGPLLIVTHGLGSEAAENNYRRALALCGTVGTPFQKFVVTVHLWFISESQTTLGDASARTAEISSLAEASGDDRLRLQAQHVGWMSALTAGKFELAIEEADAGYRRYRPADRMFHQEIFMAHDPAVCARVHKAIALWALGSQREAFREIDDLPKNFEGMNHLPTQLLAHYASCIMFVWAGDAERVRVLAGKVLEVCKRLSIQMYEGPFIVFCGWASAMLDGERDSVDGLASGLQKYEGTGVKLRMSLMRTIAAEACLCLDETSIGLEHVETAIDELVRRNEFGWHAYALVVKGTLLTRQSRLTEAEDCLLEALRVAEAQNSNSFGLRAAMAIARLWSQVGRKDEACSLMRTLLIRFPAGLSTPMLDQARGVVDEMKRQR